MRALGRAFSLLELVMVIAITGIVVAIALPRLGAQSDRARHTALEATASQLQRSIEVYRVEHLGQCPGRDPDGSVSTNPRLLVARLLRTTDDAGAVVMNGQFGPYLRSWPRNPLNDDARVRIDGVAAGANLAGWRYDSAARVIESDATAPSAPPSGAVPDVEAWAVAELASGSAVAPKGAGGPTASEDAAPK